MKIPNIQKENVPCWYELSWDSSKESIVLRVHEDFVKSNGNISGEAPIIWGMKEEHGFNRFEGNFSGKNFGFDKSLINRGLNKGFFEMETKLPVLRKKAVNFAVPVMERGRIIFLMMFADFAAENAYLIFMIGGNHFPYRPVLQFFSYSLLIQRFKHLQI